MEKTLPQNSLSDLPKQVPRVAALHKFGIAMHLLRPQTKKPRRKGWRDKPDSLETLQHGLASGDNIGWQMGAPSKTPHGYLHALDADLRDPSKKEELDAALDRALPQHLRSFVAKTGSGTGHHYFLFAPEPLPSHTLAKGDGWELALKGSGTYIVAPGSIHPSGGAYRWVPGKRLEPVSLDLIGAPVVPMHQLRKPKAPAQYAPAEPVEFEDLKAALGRIDPATLSYGEWVECGMALHHESGGEDWGFQLFDAWSQTDPRPKDKGGYPGEREMRGKWRSFRKRRGAPITGATILGMARDIFMAGFLEQWERELEDLDDPQPVDELAFLNTEPAASELGFLSPDDCVAMPTRGYIIKGLVAPRDVVAIVGAPGCGKSTLSPFLGYMVAQGKSALGLRTKQGGVFYVAAEDATGLQMRVAALRQTHGNADGFKVVTGVSNLLKRESPDLLALRNAAKSQRPSLIVIDTLAIAFPGLEENEAAAMGRVVAVARSLTTWGAAVILIHHDTKSGDGLPRGHSLLNGALDVSVALKRDGKSVKGKLTKNRNGPCDLEINFEVASFGLGRDEDDELVTAALCQPWEDTFADLGPKDDKQRAFMAALYSIVERNQCDDVEERALRMELDQSGGLSESGTSEARRKAYERVREALVGQEVLSRNRDAGTLRPLIPKAIFFPADASDSQDKSRTTLNVQRDTGTDGQDTPLRGCPAVLSTLLG